jgi:pimeloyl-ACP methyl ester carboxylesterase
MDEKVGNTHFFKDMVAGLAKRGIATIRYNKRTFTYGKEMVKNYKGDLTVKEETIEDAIFATELLRQDSRINPDRIFVAGHSMGAMLAPRINAEGGDYAGLILLAGSPRRLEEIMKDQQDEFLEGAKGIIKWMATKQISKLSSKLDNIYDLTDEEAKTAPLFGKDMFVYYLKEWGEKPAVNYLKVLDKPILVTQGDKDFHVSIEKDFNAFKEILAHHPKATFKIYPGLNHLYMKSVYNNVRKAMKEYKVPQHIEEYVIDDLADWIKEHE